MILLAHYPDVTDRTCVPCGQHNGLAWICQGAEGTSALSLSDDKLSKTEIDQVGSEFKLIVERRNSGIGAGLWLCAEVRLRSVV